MEAGNHVSSVKKFLVGQFASASVGADPAGDIYAPVLDLGRVRRAITSNRALVNNYSVTDDEVMEAVHELENEHRLCALKDGYFYAVVDAKFQGLARSYSKG